MSGLYRNPPGKAVMLCVDAARGSGSRFAPCYAKAEDVLRHPEHWTRLLGDPGGEQFRVGWIGHSRSSRDRDRFLGAVGDFRRAKCLITFAATGQR